MVDSGLKKRLEELVKVLREKVALTYPYIAHLLFTIPIRVIDDEEANKMRNSPDELDFLASTNGDVVYLRDKLFKDKKFSADAHISVVLHEMLHILLLHPFRAVNVLRRPSLLPKEKRLEIFNIASDAVVNEILVNLGVNIPKSLNLIRLEKLQEINPEISEKDAVEIIYFKLLKVVESCGGGSGNKGGKGGIGEKIGKPFDKLEEGKELTEVEKVNRIKKMEELMMALKKRGKDAGELEVELEMVSRRSRLPSITLAQAVMSNIKKDYNSYLDKRRYYHYEKTGVILTDRDRVEKKVIVVIDSSGSTCDYWKDFLNEVWSLTKGNCKVLLIQIDAKIQDVSYLEKVPDKLVLKGGGGTDFKEFFDLRWLDKVRPRIPKSELRRIPVFFMTDLDAYNVPKDCPSVFNERLFYWVLIERREVPFGNSIPYYLLKEEE